MRILYFGDPRAILALLEHRQIEICGIVHGRSGGEGAKKLGSVLKHGQHGTLQAIPRWRLPDLNHSSVLASLSETKPDLIVSVFYPRQIPQAVLDLAPGLNVHPSSLPKWRGPDPAFWVVAKREAETAISIHRLSEELDEGNIVWQEKVKVKARESGGALAVRLERQAAQVMVNFIIQLAQQKVDLSQLEGKPQKGKATWAPLLSPDELEIDWNQSALDIDAFVRAAAPDPCAFSGLGRELMVVHRGRSVQLQKPLSETELQAIPIGQALVEAESCLIRCGEGFYQLDEVTIGHRRVKGKQLALLLGGS